MNTAILDLFWDEAAEGLFFTGPDNEALIVRTKDIQDGALPSGNSVAVLNLLRLGRMTGNIELEEKADQLARAFAGEIAPIRWHTPSFSVPWILWPVHLRRSSLQGILLRRPPGR